MAKRHRSIRIARQFFKFTLWLTVLWELRALQGRRKGPGLFRRF